MNDENKATFLSRNARFLWLAALFVPPLAAFLGYELMPHEQIWHEIIYGIICLPIFCVWLIALFGCIISFLAYRSVADG